MIPGMPIYEYACTACGERTEARQSFTEPPLTECPQCGGSLRKLYSPVGIVFKGSGFYSTDQKKKPQPSSKSMDKETPEEGKKKKEGAAEGKTDKPSTPKKPAQKPA